MDSLAKAAKEAVARVDGRFEADPGDRAQAAEKARVDTGLSVLKDRIETGTDINLPDASRTKQKEQGGPVVTLPGATREEAIERVDEMVPSSARYEVRITRQGPGTLLAPVPPEWLARPIATRSKDRKRFLVGSYTDRHVTSGIHYAYRVEIVDAESGKVIATGDTPSIQAHDGHPPERVEGVTAVPSDDRITVSWRRLDDEEVDGYFVHRRPVGGADVSNRGPAAMASRASSGDAIVAPSSQMLEARADLSSIRERVGLGSPATSGALANWLVAPKLKFQKAFGSKLRVDTLRPVGVLVGEVGPDADNFTDPKPEDGVIYAYHVTAHDPYSGRGANSLPALATLPDRDPPKPPRDLVARAKNGGIVELSWLPSLSEDTTSYRLLRGLGEGTPVPIRIVAPSGKEMQVTDTLDPMSPYVYRYAVMAYDAAGNTSKPVTASPVRLPDIRPPAAPAMAEIRAGDGVVTLDWSPPVDEDVARYNVFRLRVGDAAGDEERLTGNMHRDSWLDDRSGVLGETYVYWVTAVDATGNESEPSRTYEQRFIGKVTPVTPAGVRIARDAAGHPSISWNPQTAALDTRFVVLRSDAPNGTFVPVSGALRGTRFVDRSAGANGAFYRVVARYFDGQLSQASSPVASGGAVR